MGLVCFVEKRQLVKTYGIMRFPQPLTVREVARLVGARSVVGDGDVLVTGLNEIHRVQPGELTFVDHPKYYGLAMRSPASCLLISEKIPYSPNGKALIVVDSPFRAFNQLASYFQPRSLPEGVYIHPTAEIHPTAHISPGVYIGHYVRIGAGTVIFPNVTILDRVVIGRHCRIGPGTVIGYDAFYYKRWENDRLEPMYSCGTVVIEDFVQIGANCTIDRGVTDETRIGSGTKIDNLVHVGHDVRIGKDCIIAAQVGIAGGTVIEDGVTLWGQVGISKALRIGEKAVVHAQSGVTKDLAGHRSYTGSPAIESVKHHRQVALLRFLVDSWDRLKHILQSSSKKG